MALLEQLNKLTAQNIFLDENTGGKGRYFKSRFLQAGLVKYSFGVCILSKETIDKFVDGFVGCPVIINHKDVTNESAKDDRVGVISRVWYDEKDGWFWCEGVIFDEEAISLIESGYNVSCQYEITEYSNNTTKALHNGNPYDKVILNGKPEHLAIVKTPRYESAMIAVNALEIEMKAENEDKWITIHPNGEDGKGRHLLLKDGENPKEAIERTYGEGKQSDTKDGGDKTKRREIEHKGARISIIPDGKYSDIKIDAPEGKAFKNGDTWYRTEALTEKAEELAKKIIDEEFGQSDTTDKQSDSKGDLDIKKTTVKMKSGKEKEIEYVDSVPEGYKKLEGAMTAPLGYTWYHNGKSVIDKERKTILVKDSDTAKNTIKQAINELKENDMFNKLFNKKEQKMEKEELKSLFMDCIQEVLTAQNEAEEEKKKEEDAKNEVEEKKEKEEEKAENKKACNEDKRKLIDEVAGMMKSAGCDDEVIRTAIAKMEKIGYDKSEAGTADNCGKKGKNEDEEEKEEALNKAKNSIDVLKGLLSQGEVRKPASKYITKSQAIELGNQLF